MHIRPATAKDFDRHFQRPSQTVKAWVIEENGRTLGIGGFYLSEGRAVMFAEITAGARAKCLWPARTMLTSARHVLAQAKQTGVPIFAVADPSVENSAKLLKKLGFVQGNKETFVWAPPHSQ